MKQKLTCNSKNFQSNNQTKTCSQKNQEKYSKTNSEFFQTPSTTSNKAFTSGNLNYINHSSSGICLEHKLDFHKTLHKQNTNVKAPVGNSHNVHNNQVVKSAYSSGIAQSTSSGFSNTNISNQPSSEELNGIDDFINHKSAKYEDWLFLKDKATGKLKKCFACLNGSELSLYLTEKKCELISISYIAGFFVRDGSSEGKIIQKEKYYFFTLYHSKEKTHHFYCNNLKSKNQWIEHIKEAIGILNISDFYKFTETLGTGSFGTVKKAISNSTNKSYAVKIISKNNMKDGEINLIRNEIDLLMHFQHPNIVRLYETFETADDICLVMEYLAGGDLLDFMQNHMDGDLPEKTVANIIYSIASVIKYLNSYGVIHRDLKPENIMLLEKSENPKIKLIDFGLTRVVCEGEKLCDGFGTISYVAPEVLSRKPYNKKIDVWSLGVILYSLLSKGRLPFEDEKNDDDAIAKKALLIDPSFPDELFGKRSKSALLLIMDCLNKDPQKRISIEDFLHNDWLVRNISKDNLLIF